jgi:hypothetical protein
MSQKPDSGDGPHYHPTIVTLLVGAIIWALLVLAVLWLIEL